MKNLFDCLPNIAYFVFGMLFVWFIILIRLSFVTSNVMTYSATVNCLDDGKTVTISSNSQNDEGDAMLNYAEPGCTLVTSTNNFKPL